MLCVLTKETGPGKDSAGIVSRGSQMILSNATMILLMIVMKTATVHNGLGRVPTINRGTQTDSRNTTSGSDCVNHKDPSKQNHQPPSTIRYFLG